MPILGFIFIRKKQKCKLSNPDKNKYEINSNDIELDN